MVRLVKRSKEAYKEYFKRMEEKNRKEFLDGILWDSVGMMANDAVRDECYTFDELKKEFPDLFY